MLFYRISGFFFNSQIKRKLKLGKYIKIIFVHPKFRDYKIKIRRINCFSYNLLYCIVPYNPYLIGNYFFVFLGK